MMFRKKTDVGSEAVALESTGGLPVPEREGKVKKRINKEEIVGWTLTGIPILGFLIFGLIPLVFSFYISFNTFRGLRLNTAQWVGFDNFGKVLSDPLFWQSFGTDLFLRVRISKRMAELNISPKDLKPPWQCKKCSDSGFLPNGRQCSCYPKKRR